MSKRMTYGAFKYQKGKKVAFVKHYNIQNASQTRRETVANYLLERGIRKICANGTYYSINSFLKIKTKGQK